jgi:hypothetical protein
VVKKATWRFRTLGPEAKRVVAAAPSLAAAARQLDLDVTTLHRWFREGKLTRPTNRRRRPHRAAAPSGPGGDRPAWRAAVGASHILTATEMELASLAERALTMARDPSLKPETQLQAMGRYQQLIKQLDLEAESDDGETATTGPRPPWPRRVG